MGNKLLLIIPAYNEAENIEEVVNNLRDNYPKFDYVIVNDGSTDNTAEICAECGYTNMRTFRRAFLKEVGHLPSDQKRKLKERVTGPE